MNISLIPGVKHFNIYTKLFQLQPRKKAVAAGIHFFVNTVKSLLSPRGGYLISGPKREGA